jgi:hypothetical protein
MWIRILNGQPWANMNILNMRTTIYVTEMIKLEKKYAPALDNYGQSCFVMIDI